MKPKSIITNDEHLIRLMEDLQPKTVQDIPTEDLLHHFKKMYDELKRRELHVMIDTEGEMFAFEK